MTLLIYIRSTKWKRNCNLNLVGVHDEQVLVDKEVETSRRTLGWKHRASGKNIRLEAQSFRIKNIRPPNRTARKAAAEPAARGWTHEGPWHRGGTWPG